MSSQAGKLCFTCRNRASGRPPREGPRQPPRSKRTLTRWDPSTAMRASTLMAPMAPRGPSSLSRFWPLPWSGSRVWRLSSHGAPLRYGMALLLQRSSHTPASQTPSRVRSAGCSFSRLSNNVLTTVASAPQPGRGRRSCSSRAVRVAVAPAIPSSLWPVKFELMEPGDGGSHFPGRSHRCGCR